MVIDNFYTQSISIFPMKTNPPLTIDSNAILTSSISRKEFQAIRWRKFEIVEVCGVVDHASILTPCVYSQEI